MTTHRRLLVFGLLAGFLVLGAGVCLLWPRTAITAENAAKIREGMTLAEVADILGGPPRNDGVGLIAFHRLDRSEGTIPRSDLIGSLDQLEGKSWLSDEVLVTIT